MISAFLVAVLIAACEDSTAPRTVPKVSYMWFDDMDSDSICGYARCRGLSNGEWLDMWSIHDWLRSGPFTECSDFADGLADALFWDQIQVVDHFISPSQRGAFDTTTRMIYIREDLVNGGPSYYNIDLGHEAGHYAGYGWYGGHQTNMDNMSRSCQPGH